MRKIMFFAILVVILVVFSVFTVADAKNAQYTYYKTQTVGEFQVFADQMRYSMGDTMKLKYAVKSKQKAGSGLKVNVYRINDSGNTSMNTSNNCIVYSGKTLLKTVNVPSTAKNEVYYGDIDIALTAANGFSVSQIDTSQPLTYAVNRDQQQAVLVTISDPNETLINYDYLGSMYEPCHWDTNISFFLDSASVAKPDLKVQDVSLSLNELSSVNDKFVITYTVKNVGQAASTEQVEVCLVKRNTNVTDPIYNANNNYSICHHIDPLAVGGSEIRYMEFDPAKNKFGRVYSDRESENDVLTVGQNRLALQVDPYALLTSGESNYANNETVFYITVAGEQSVTEDVVETLPVQEEEKQESNQSVPEATQISSGNLIKSPIHPAVYQYENGKRRPFANAALYYTWYKNFDTVKLITADEMEAIPLGNPMSVKPGVGLVKFPYNSMVYEVLSDSVIKHIPNEVAAKASYGSAWASKIVTLPEIYYLFYTVQK